MSAYYVVGDTRTVTDWIPDGSIDFIMTSPPLLPASRCCECLGAFAAVERLDLVCNIGHPGADLRTPTHAFAARAPRLDVGLRHEQTGAAAANPLTALERNILELHALNCCGVGTTGPLGGLGKRDHRFAGNDLGQNEGVRARSGVEVAQFKREVGLPALDSQKRSQRFQDGADRSGVDLPDVDGSTAAPDIRPVYVAMAVEQVMEKLDRLVVQLFNRAPRLIRRLLRVRPLAGSDLVPVDMDAYVSIGVDDSRTVSQFFICRLSHPTEVTT